MKPVFVSLLLVATLLLATGARGQSVDTYVNPIIPGDHPDPTLTRIDAYYYTSGSSFNVTPKIYRSTDLVHWEVIAQPVSADWDLYGDVPAGGIWGGHTVYHNSLYWHFFGRGTGDRAMYFVTANRPEGPWGTPFRMTVPSGVPGFGVDNSIFIDDDNRWFLLIKNGRSVNYLVELGPNGQPGGEVYDLTWLNPDSEGNPYGWAEGPVMWKHDGYYYYSFAQHLAGNQYVMRSTVQGAPLSDDPATWETPRVLFEGFQSNFRTPNHTSPAVTTTNGTHWVISQSYDGSGGGEWQALGRQGILSQIVYDEEGWPTARYPNGIAEAPALPSNGIPWTVPRSDMFNGSRVAPDWSFLGFTPDDSYSLTERPGWLRLKPSGGNRFLPGENTVIQNASEHAYTLITCVDFAPGAETDEAGLWTFNGPESLHAKLFVTIDAGSARIVTFSFDGTAYTAPLSEGGPTWLRLQRDGHHLTGSYSLDGTDWAVVGEPIDVSKMDRHHPASESGYDFNAFTGNQQGPYVIGDTPADFGLYIYRDAYSPIPARYPTNFNGVAPSGGGYLGGIHDGEWAMYAGVEFGTEGGTGNDADYPKAPESLTVTASSATTGGIIEVWLDSLDTGQKIAEVPIESTGDWSSYASFNTDVTPVSGQHDVFLKFVGASPIDELFRLQSIAFSARLVNTVIMEEGLPATPSLGQNYPNPFGKSPTTIAYALPAVEHVTLSVYNVLGQEVVTLVDGIKPAGRHTIEFSERGLPSGVYFYRLKAGDYTTVKMMTRAR